MEVRPEYMGGHSTGLRRLIQQFGAAEPPINAREYRSEMETHLTGDITE